MERPLDNDQFVTSVPRDERCVEILPQARRSQEGVSAIKTAGGVQYRDQDMAKAADQVLGRDLRIARNHSRERSPQVKLLC